MVTKEAFYLQNLRMKETYFKSCPVRVCVDPNWIIVVVDS